MREAMLRARAPVGIVPELELVSATTADHPAAERTESSIEKKHAASDGEPAASRGRPTWPLLAVGFALTLAAGFWLGTRGGPGAAAVAAHDTALAPTTTATVPTTTATVPTTTATVGTALPTRDGPDDGPAIDEPTQATVEDTRVPSTSRDRGRARPTPAGPAGRLNLVAVPAAEVFVRGRSLGETPLVGVELPPGRHTLELRGSDGTTRRATVTIRSGEVTRESVR
jgi:hypothetical protein